MMVKKGKPAEVEVEVGTWMKKLVFSSEQVRYISVNDHKNDSARM